MEDAKKEQKAQYYIMVQIIYDFHNLSTILFISLYNIIKLAFLLSFV